MPDPFLALRRTKRLQGLTEHMDPILSCALKPYRKNSGCESTKSSDMSKAFHSLWPPLLIKKLEVYQFSEEALQLMRSYFSQWMNRVRLGTEISQWTKRTERLPPGVYIWTVVVGSVSE